MDIDFNALLAAFDRRIEILGRLAGSLDSDHCGDSQALVVFVERRTGEQREALADWARVEAEIEPWRRQWPDLFSWDVFSGDITSCGFPAEVRERWLNYRTRYRGLLGEVQRNFLRQGALLRRARRTAAALSSLLSVTAPTYGPPLLGATVRCGSEAGSSNPRNIFSVGK
jgi:hypothetical protein